MTITTIDNIVVAVAAASVSASAVLKDNLHNLDAKTVELNCDLPTLHLYFHNNYDQFVEWGKTLYYMIHHLLKAYPKVKCFGFVTFAGDMQISTAFNREPCVTSHKTDLLHLWKINKTSMDPRMSSPASRNKLWYILHSFLIPHQKGNLKLSKSLFNNLNSVAEHADTKAGKNDQRKCNNKDKVTKKHQKVYEIWE